MKVDTIHGQLFGIFQEIHFCFSWCHPPKSDNSDTKRCIFANFPDKFYLQHLKASIYTLNRDDWWVCLWVNSLKLHWVPKMWPFNQQNFVFTLKRRQSSESNRTNYAKIIHFWNIYIFSLSSLLSSVCLVSQTLTCMFCGAPWPSPQVLWSGWARGAVRWCTRCPFLQDRSLPVQTAPCTSRAVCGWRTSKAGDPKRCHPSAASTGSICRRDEQKENNYKVFVKSNSQTVRLYV